SPFTLSNVARPWPGEQRFGAVSAFGFGGTNFHAVLASYDAGPAVESGLDVWPAELFLLRGASPDEARATAQGILDRLAADPDARLCDLAHGICRTGSGPVQAAVVAGSREELTTRLRAVIGARAGDGVFLAAPKPGQVACLFPGPGRQRP